MIISPSYVYDKILLLCALHFDYEIEAVDFVQINGAHKNLVKQGDVIVMRMHGPFL